METKENTMQDARRGCWSIWTWAREAFNDTPLTFSQSAFLHDYLMFSFPCHHIPPGDKAEECLRAKVTNPEVQATPCLNTESVGCMLYVKIQVITGCREQMVPQDLSHMVLKCPLETLLM